MDGMDPRIRALLDELGALERDSLGRSNAQVYRAKDRYLKIAPRGTLERAAVMQDYFARKGFSLPVIAYDSDGASDYLLTAAAPGRAAVDLLDRPEWMAGRLGEIVRALHEADAADCPLADVNERAIALCERNPARTLPAEAALLRKDALVHGDCCLPNVFFSGQSACFIDLGDAGVGDRHFDLYWAQWSLEYNLGTGAYGERMFDAYGRDAIDKVRLSACAALSNAVD